MIYLTDDFYECPIHWQRFILELHSRTPGWNEISNDDVNEIITNELKKYGINEDYTDATTQLTFSTPQCETFFILKWA
jgi:hypothetical protein